MQSSTLRRLSTISVLFALSVVAACRDGSPHDNGASGGPKLVASAEPMDVRLPLPAFQLVDQHGQKFDSADMRGKVWIVDFIFTSCPTICPTLTKKMADLVRRSEEQVDLRFLSISVDPENDTPEKLSAFVEKNGFASPRWFLVTGTPRVIEDTVLRGFKVGMGKDAAGNLFHGEHFVVVDKEGRARGFFLANEDGTKDLLERVRQVRADAP